MILQAAITIFLALSSAKGDCQAQRNECRVPEVVHYLKINTYNIRTSDPTIRTAVQNYLKSDHTTISLDYLATSCKQIGELKPHYDSGYYWIQGALGAVGVYCEMGINNTFGQSGGWMRIAYVNMRNNHSQCPPGLIYNVTEGRRLCHKPSLTPGCDSIKFRTHGVNYSKVCGRVIAYQYYQPNGFGPSRYTPGISQTYVDGVSITHGSPKQHVWSLAAAHDEVFQSGFHAEHTSCPCLHPSQPFHGIIPSFVGEDYYCETGSRTRAQKRCYFDDPLWDGKGCEGENKCCDRGGPWFCKQLPQPTQDDIEMRVCTNQKRSHEDYMLEQIEFYVQ